MVVVPFNLRGVWKNSRERVKAIRRKPTNRRFKFNKRSQLFIGTHNEALSVAMRVNNPDRSGRENRRLTRSPKSIRLCWDCRRWSPSSSCGTSAR